METSFGQILRKKKWSQKECVICFNCEQHGHVAASCPLPKQRTLQQMSQEALCADEEEKEVRSISSNHSGGRPRVGIFCGRG